MNILAHMKKEKSGLAFTTLELCDYTQRAGHKVAIRQPGEDAFIYTPQGWVDSDVQVHTIHSQLGPAAYFDRKPKLMWAHGEPLSSVGNGVSMRAIIDLAPMCEAFICMRKDEYPIWQSIKRTYVVPKGVDLEKYKPLPGITERLSGEPACVYFENWRGQRNPLYVIAAMERVWKKLPKARLHLYNCTDQKMLDTFKVLIAHNKWTTFVRTLSGPVEDVNLLLNRCDIVVSGLFPLYARSIEAFGAGKPLICPGYREHDDYPFPCDLDVESMAAAIIKAWERRDWNARQWAEQHHDVKETVNQAIDIYKRYV